METNNKIIAEFMGAKLTKDLKIMYPVYEGDSSYVKNLKYHSDWNWLMEVVEKIRSIDNKAKEDFRTKLLHYQRNNKTLFNLSILEGKEYVYNACLEFIKWYNENKIQTSLKINLD